MTDGVVGASVAKTSGHHGVVLTGVYGEAGKGGRLAYVWFNAMGRQR